MMIPWEANTAFCSTFLNKTVIFFIIYLFISTCCCHCRPIYNATDQVHQTAAAAPPIITNPNRSQPQHHHYNHTNAVVRVIVTKTSSTSYSAGGVRPSAIKPNMTIGHGHDHHDDEEADHYSNLHQFPDISRLFSTTTQSSSRPKIQSFSTTTSTTTTPRPTTYHPDFFFSPFYTINRSGMVMVPKRKIENRSISQSHTGGTGADDYQNHPDNIFSVFYHAFSQQGYPSGSFSFHTQTQHHHHHHPGHGAGNYANPINHQPPQIYHHQITGAGDDGSRKNVETFQAYGQNPTIPTLTSPKIDREGSEVISVVSETRSLTAASTAASLSAESRSISAASTISSSSAAVTATAVAESRQRPVSAALSNKPDDHSDSSTIYSGPSVNPAGNEDTYDQFPVPLRGTKRLRKSHASQVLYHDATVDVPEIRIETRSNSNQDYVEIPATSSTEISMENPKIELRSAPTTPERLIQWEQPEQIWGEPEKIWGKSERNWGEPEQIWSQPHPLGPTKLFTWPSVERQAKMSPSQLVRSEGPISDISVLGPKIYELQPEALHNIPQDGGQETVTAERRQDAEEDLELIDDELYSSVDSNNNPKFYELGEDEEDEPKELNLDENTMNSTIENAQLAARSWELPELTPSSSLMSPLHHTSSGGGGGRVGGAEMTAESIQVPQNIKNGHKIIVDSNHHTVARVLNQTNQNTIHFSDVVVKSSLPMIPISVNLNSTDADDEYDNFESQRTNIGSTSNNSSIVSSSSERPSKKFGYVLDGSDVRKYRVEERTPDGYIVGEYGIINNDNGFLRGVRYTADGTINPRLIHQALMKFLSL